MSSYEEAAWLGEPGRGAQVPQCFLNQRNINMFGAPDPEADTPKFAQIRADTRASRSKALPPPDPPGRGRVRELPDTRPDTPDTATFSIWPLVVSIW
jgi:hypothetical protein